MTTKEIDRYPHDWPARSRDTKRSRQHGEKVQCSLCKKLHPWDHVETHHSSYQGERDRAGVNIFPVCGSKQDLGTCHHLVHQKGNWIKEKNIWHNRNSPAIVRQLQKGYAGAASGDGPWLGIVAAIGVVSIGWFVVNSFMGIKSAKETAIATETVNVRQCPAVTCPKAGSPIAKGTSVHILEEQDGWIRIGHEVWIAKNYTKVE